VRRSPFRVRFSDSTLVQGGNSRIAILMMFAAIRLVEDFSYEEEIHMLFAQRLESGPRNFIPSSGQPT
jgi:hypothetical protein